MFLDICKIDLHDDITFEFKKIGEIREGDEYTGYRVSLSANYSPMAVPLKLDITTGDKITPREIEYRFKLLLEDRELSVLAYNLETIMAEKLETVVSRGIRIQDREITMMFIFLLNCSIKILKQSI